MLSKRTNNKTNKTTTSSPTHPTHPTHPKHTKISIACSTESRPYSSNAHTTLLRRIMQLSQHPWMPLRSRCGGNVIIKPASVLPVGVPGGGPLSSCYSGSRRQRGAYWHSVASSSSVLHWEVLRAPAVEWWWWQAARYGFCGAIVDLEHRRSWKRGGCVVIIVVIIDGSIPCGNARCYYRWQHPLWKCTLLLSMAASPSTCTPCRLHWQHPLWKCGSLGCIIIDCIIPFRFCCCMW